MFVNMRACDVVAIVLRCSTEASLMLVQFKTISKIVNKETGVSFKGTPRKPGSLPTHAPVSPESA